MMNLDELRAEIDKIDDEMVRLFSSRMQISGQICDFKSKNGLAIHDPVREQQKLELISNKVDESLVDFVEALYVKIFELSRDYQAQLKSNA